MSYRADWKFSADIMPIGPIKSYRPDYRLSVYISIFSCTDICIGRYKIKPYRSNTSTEWWHQRVYNCGEDKLDHLWYTDPNKPQAAFLFSSMQRKGQRMRQSCVRWGTHTLPSPSLSLNVNHHVLKHERNGTILAEAVFVVFKECMYFLFGSDTFYAAFHVPPPLLNFVCTYILGLLESGGLQPICYARMSNAYRASREFTK